MVISTLGDLTLSSSKLAMLRTPQHMICARHRRRHTLITSAECRAVDIVIVVIVVVVVLIIIIIIINHHSGFVSTYK